ncbi:hypothetical protein DESA109040_15415 [Deinococcus saxicola]|uniref:hypothetical protein n=1 Tax=Deinococcus saxicola TaxID=249406 RepID=UPI0039EF2973
MPSPPDATEFFSMTYGEITVSGWVTLNVLRRVEAGEVIRFTVYEAMSEDIALGDLICSFAAGKLAPFRLPEET